jgi:Bacteriophage tail sheath protein
MPSTYSYPGVYVEEVPSGVRPIAGVSTSDTAFVDFFPRGPMGEAVRITGMTDLERRFGGLDQRSEGGYALKQYFLNGGQVAWVVRVASGTPTRAELRLAEGGSPAGGALTVEARDPGTWGQNLQVGIDHRTAAPGQFNLVVRELRTVDGRTEVVASEIHRNLTTGTNDERSARAVVDADSALIRVTDLGAGPPPAPTSTEVDVTSPAALRDPDPLEDTPDDEQPFRRLGNPLDDNGTEVPVSDGLAPDAEALTDGLLALESIAPAVFNILCLPATANLSDDERDAVIAEATAFCRRKRAFYIVDPPAGTDTLDEIDEWMDDHGDGLRDRNAAVYFPSVEIADPLNESRPRMVGPSGTMAGVYARTDTERGIWKAPAGTDARLAGAKLPIKVSDAENGALNPRAVNVLRTFPVYGNVAWGARTLDGSDQQASEWKYVPVRRTALFIEESLYQGIQWAVFEGNDETLWAQLRLNVGAFMHDLFRQGAFQGTTPRESYFVKCDAETTTQSDIDRGIVNVLVGFAPLKPAEFVVLRIQQIAGQLET